MDCSPGPLSIIAPLYSLRKRALQFEHLGGGDEQRLWSGETRLQVHRIQAGRLTLPLETISIRGQKSKIADSNGARQRRGKGIPPENAAACQRGHTTASAAESDKDI
jgi:hypothetical protein